jgi:predicted enzyme related to lactoylglutathione lyase
LWREPLNSIPFGFEDGWKFCFEYTVADYAAEVGFYIDILGFFVRAFSPVFAQFSLPGDEFGFNVVAAQEGQEETHPNSIRMQISVKNIDRVAQSLEDRGVAFEKLPTPIQEGSPILSGYFRSPHGVCIELIGEVSQRVNMDRSPELVDSSAEPVPALEELLELPDDDDAEDGDEDGTYPEAEESEVVQATTLEPEYVDEISDEDQELASGDALTAKSTIDGQRQNSRVVSAEKPGGGYSPRSVPLNTLRQIPNPSRDGSVRWPANNDKRNGRSVFDEANVDEL